VWLAPWNHTFGGSHNFRIALHNGGTLYIDHGKPTAGSFAETVRNLREIAPTAYFNVPKGYEMLVEHLRADTALRSNFFSRLKLLFFAGFRFRYRSQIGPGGRANGSSVARAVDHSGILTRLPSTKRTTTAAWGML
jgi:hypothetical protein